MAAAGGRDLNCTGKNANLSRCRDNWEVRSMAQEEHPALTLFLECVCFQSDMVVQACDLSCSVG